MFNYLSDPVAITMHDAINEAVKHGKTVWIGNFENFPPRVKTLIFEEAKKEGLTEDQVRAMFKSFDIDSEAVAAGKLSLHGQDALEGAYMHALELYDKELDEAILMSDDIVKAYNAMVDGKIQQAIDVYHELEKLIDKESDEVKKGHEKEFEESVNIVTASDLRAIMGSLGTLMDLGKDYGMSDSEIKDMLRHELFSDDEDPEKIKKIVQGRVQYNNAIVGSLKQMLKINYKLLGITKDEALMLTKSLESDKKEERAEGIKGVKAALLANEAKFRKGNTIDLRPLGAGVCFITGEELGPIEQDVQIDRMLQLLMTRDCVVVGHGNTETEETKKLAEEYENDVVSRYKDTGDQIRAEYERRVDEVIKELDKLRDEIDDYLPYGGRLIEEWKKRVLDIYKKRFGDRFDLLKEAKDRMDEKFDVYYNNPDNDEAFKAYEKASAEYRELCKKFPDVKVDIPYDAILKVEYYYRDKQSEKRENFDKVDKARREELDRLRDDVNARLDKLREDGAKEYAEFKKKYMEVYEKTKDTARWTIQPVKTLTGGPYADVEELIRQLIKEGFKDIFMVCCNPGHHQLPKDIRDRRDVTVTHAENSLLSEAVNTIPHDEFYDVEASLMLTEAHLIKEAAACGISYWDDDYLDECTNFVTSGEYQQVLVEGVLSKAWETLVNIIKKAIGFLVNLFKKFIGLIKQVWEKIKAFFKKMFDRSGFNNKLTKKISSGVIMVESARVDKYDAQDWKTLQEKVLKACEAINKKIDRQEQEQLRAFNDAQRKAEQNTKSIHENISTEYDDLISLLI